MSLSSITNMLSKAVKPAAEKEDFKLQGKAEDAVAPEAAEKTDKPKTGKFMAEKSTSDQSTTDKAKAGVKTREDDAPASEARPQAASKQAASKQADGAQAGAKQVDGPQVVASRNAEASTVRVNVLEAGFAPRLPQDPVSRAIRDVGAGLGTLVGPVIGASEAHPLAREAPMLFAHFRQAGIEIGANGYANIPDTPETARWLADVVKDLHSYGDLSLAPGLSGFHQFADGSKLRDLGFSPRSVDAFNARMNQHFQAAGLTAAQVLAGVGANVATVNTSRGGHTGNPELRPGPRDLSGDGPFIELKPGPNGVYAQQGDIPANSAIVRQQPGVVTAPNAGPLAPGGGSTATGGALSLGGAGAPVQPGRQGQIQPQQPQATQAPQQPRLEAAPQGPQVPSRQDALPELSLDQKPGNTPNQLEQQPHPSIDDPLGNQRRQGRLDQIQAPEVSADFSRPGSLDDFNFRSNNDALRDYIEGNQRPLSNVEPRPQLQPEPELADNRPFFEQQEDGSFRISTPKLEMPEAVQADSAEFGPRLGDRVEFAERGGPLGQAAGSGGGESSGGSGGGSGGGFGAGGASASGGADRASGGGGTQPIPTTVAEAARMSPAAVADLVIGMTQPELLELPVSIREEFKERLQSAFPAGHPISTAYTALNDAGAAASVGGSSGTSGVGAMTPFGEINADLAAGNEAVLQRIRDASANEINAWLGPMSEAERLELPEPVHKAILANFERQLEELPVRAPNGSGDVAASALANTPEMERIGKEILFDAGIDLAVSTSGEQLKGVGPFLVFLSDSGSGSFVAYPPIRRVLDQAGVDAAVVVTGDHKSGAYGPREQDEIVRLVFNWGGTASSISSADAESLASVLAMACNTACIADFYRQEVGIDFPSDGIPVLNLIDNTAKDVAHPSNRNIYGTDPVILSTEATRLSGHYPRLVSQYSEGEVTAHNIGGSDKPIRRPDGEMQLLDLATLVNQQAPFDPAREDELAFVVKHYVDKFPADMTSLVMCCTHYPALTQQFRRELDSRGMANVPIVNPMPVQGVRILEALAASAEGQEASVGNRRVRPDVVVTSADGVDNPGAAPGSGEQTLREGLGAATFTGRDLPTFFGHPLGADFPGQRVADFINGYTGPVADTDADFFDLRPDNLRQPPQQEGRAD